MCGIAGFSYIKPDKKISKRFFNTEKYLFHRGPENTGFFKNPHLDLIHTRLSIVDIKGGNQPIQNKRYVLVANCEIYNDPEIRKKIEHINLSQILILSQFWHYMNVMGLMD